MLPNNLILGTAQLGMPYGIANTSGQPDISLSTQIVGTALDKGVMYFDTAQVYGESEKVLGKALASSKAQFRAKVITKVASENLQDRVALEAAFSLSLQNLGIPSLYCFMLHHEEYLAYLDTWQGEILRAWQEQAKIQHVGISVYSPEKALEALEHPLIHIVQIPSSLFDKRFIQAGVFEKAKELKKEMHIRSVFLQGVLCMNAQRLPGYLAPLQSCVQKFHALCEQYACSPSQAALTWVQSREPEALLIFGAESTKQVLENTDSVWTKKIILHEFLHALDSIEIPQEPELLNPALWKR